MDEMSREHRKRFYVDLVRYVRGEPNRPETIRETQAEIAKRLADERGARLDRAAHGVALHAGRRSRAALTSGSA